MEKNIYENPRMEHRQVKARCGMLAGSGYTEGVSPSVGSKLSLTMDNLRLQEGGDFGFTGSNTFNDDNQWKDVSE